VLMLIGTLVTKPVDTALTLEAVVTALPCFNETSTGRCTCRYLCVGRFIRCREPRTKVKHCSAVNIMHVCAWTELARQGMKQGRAVELR
jgi:hypothetical protein